MALAAMQRLPAAHDDLIHDVQLDYYGKQLASAGSDRRIKIFDCYQGDQRQQTAELTGHEGPVWQVAWAHPEFGNILASCSYDRQVFVWKEHSPQQWGLVHKYLGHEGSVNAVAWGPREAGMRLACASSDENVSVLTHYGEGRWGAVMFKAHKTGCNALSWAPVEAAGAPMRLVTGGCDNLVKVWRSDDGETWVEAAVLPALHTDWVRDVAWAPSLGTAGGAMIASCAQDRKVAVWSEGGGQWSSKVIELPCAVWSVSWSVTGGILAAASGDNQVTLWRESALGEWQRVGQLSEDSSPEAAS
jgi:protein transport protein SEC13